jgi:hypothetical protein
MPFTKFYMDKPIKVLTQKRLMKMMFSRDLLKKIGELFANQLIYCRVGLKIIRLSKF